MNFDHPLQRKHLLTPLENDWYRNVCQSFWQQQLLWDGTDMTTELLANNEESIAILTAKSEGIVAGIQEAHFLLNKNLFMPNGTKGWRRGVPWEKIVRLSGSAQTILRIERTLLNFLSRLSGIATKTYEIRQSIPQEILLCATRKTLWGALDKRAVAVGGGGTHRLGLLMRL